MAENLQNSEDLDQMPHHVASDAGLHFLPKHLLIGVSSIKWIKSKQYGIQHKKEIRLFSLPPTFICLQFFFHLFFFVS